jgi:hypothetical protein
MMKKIIVIGFCILLAAGSFAQVQKKKLTEKMHNPKYCLFYDNHTMPAIPDYGETFDAEAFTDRIKACGVDYLTFHARCNLGMAYYDTKIGIRHPTLKYDLFGKLAEACKRKGIALTAYLNGGISNAEGIQHREWTTLYFDGRAYREPRFTPFVRTMCPNTGYRDHLIAMVKEIGTKYPVSGFFIDCMNGFPCVCPTCVRMMKEKDIDITDEAEVTKFGELSSYRLAQDIAKAARGINPDYLLYFNGPTFEQNAELGSYLECEHLPTAHGGYEVLPVLAAYMRTLTDMPILNMNGRFYRWGDFGGLRPEEAIKSELLYGIANGMRPNVGGHFHPRGDLETAVLDRLEKIYKELQTYEPWIDNAKNITEIAVVYQKGNQHIRRQSRTDGNLKSAVRMLCELKQQFDVVTTFSDWNKYEVLVIPDDITFDENLAKRVKIHIDAGKAVISSGSSGLDTELKRFVLEKEWGVRYIGKNEYDPAYFIPGKNVSKGLPEMPLSLYAPGINVETLSGTKTEANIVKPYFNKVWDGEYAFYYTPPDKVTDKPALTVNGRVAHFTHNIFTGYNTQASVELRSIFSNVLDIFLPTPLLKYDNFPSYARAFVTEQPGRRMVHLLAYLPELRGASTEMIEEPITLNNVKISLRIAKRPEKVYLAPGKKSLPFKVANGYVNVTIPTINGYSLLVFE